MMLWRNSDFLSCSIIWFVLPRNSSRRNAYQPVPYAFSVPLLSYSFKYFTLLILLNQQIKCLMPLWGQLNFIDYWETLPYEKLRQYVTEDYTKKTLEVLLSCFWDTSLTDEWQFLDNQDTERFYNKILSK